MSFLSLYKNELKLTRRDPIMVYSFVMILVMMIALQFFREDLGIFYIPLSAFTIILIPMVCGMASAFVILDEREEGVLQALQVLPVSYLRILMAKLIGSAALTLVLVIIAPFILRIDMSLELRLILAVLLTLEAPIMGLLVVDFANTRLQGMTLAKIGGWILFLPVFIKLIGMWRGLSTDWSKLTAFLPTYWAYKVFEEALIGGDYFSDLVISIIVHVAWIVALAYMFTRKP